MYILIYLCFIYPHSYLYQESQGIHTYVYMWIIYGPGNHFMCICVCVCACARVCVLSVSALHNLSKVNMDCLGIIDRIKTHNLKLEGKKVKALVVQLCPTLCHTMDCSPPGSSMEFSRQGAGMRCHFLLQGIFPTQELNSHILYILFGGLSEDFKPRR